MSVDKERSKKYYYDRSGFFCCYGYLCTNDVFKKLL